MRKTAVCHHGLTHTVKEVQCQNHALVTAEAKAARADAVYM